MISKKRLERWVKRWQEGSGYHVLLGLLLSMFVLVPLVDARGWGGFLMETVLLVIFFQALTVVCRHRRQRVIGLILFSPILAHWILLGDNSVIPALPDAGSTTLVMTLMAIGSALFLFYLIFLTVAYIFHHRRVDWPQISAAASSYLLLGLAWKMLYRYLHQLDTGSFRGFAQVMQDGKLIQRPEAGDWLYFSFVTMTTLGYGDIVPVSLPARMLVVLQAIVGQLFLVILVARLVAMVGGRGETPPAEK